MRIRVSNPLFVPDLRRFLHERGYITELLAADLVVASPSPGSLRLEHAVKQLAADIRHWQRRHRKVQVSIETGPGPGDTQP